MWRQRISAPTQTEHLTLPPRLALAQNSANESKGRTLRFLANVDPVDVARALNGLDPETTMAVVVSKTFTTAETMLNARTVRCATLWIVQIRPMLVLEDGGHRDASKNSRRRGGLC